MFLSLRKCCCPRCATSSCATLTLQHLLLRCQQVVVAERCYAAIGDLAKARFLRRVAKLADKERAAMLAADPTLDPATGRIIKLAIWPCITST